MMAMGNYVGELALTKELHSGSIEPIGFQLNMKVFLVFVNKNLIVYNRRNTTK